MATPLSASALVRALKDEGVKVVEHRDWRNHNRNHVGSWGPVYGVMIHHTVTTGTSGSVDLCYNGRSDLPGPLCHGVIAKDGTVYLVGNGRANHAGSGDDDVLRAVIAETELPPDNETNTDGNKYFYGFECINLGNGKDEWPSVQVEATVRASAALCRAHGWGKEGDTSVIGHLEWQPGKIDPYGPGVSMTDIRARVAERLKHPAGWSPGDNDQQEGDDVPDINSLGTTADFKQPAPPGDWVTVKFDRKMTDGKWSDKGAAETVLSGDRRFSVSFAVRLEGLTAGQEVQMRLATNARVGAGGAWERTYTWPIDSPSHVSGGGHFTHTFNGQLIGDNDARLVCQVLVLGGTEGVQITAARAEVLSWAV